MFFRRQVNPKLWKLNLTRLCSSGQNLKKKLITTKFALKFGQEKWKFVVTDADPNQLTINGLMADTTYIFQVRGVCNDQEGHYRPANDAVKTNESLTTYLLTFSVRINDMNPPKYQLFAQELKQSRNYVAKTRKLILAKSIITIGWLH